MYSLECLWMKVGAFHELMLVEFLSGERITKLDDLLVAHRLYSHLWVRLPAWVNWPANSQLLWDLHKESGG
jgi:hypothetical protein